MAGGPFKTNAPLVVDANAELPASVALEGLETVAGQSGQVLQRSGGLKSIEFEAGGSLEAGEGLHRFTGSEIPSPLVAIAEDHGFSLALVTSYVKRNDGVVVAIPMWAAG